jgi:hypothetical protein
MKDYLLNLYSGFSFLGFDAFWLIGGFISFVFFTTLFIFIFEIKNKYSIIGIVSALLVFVWYFSGLGYIYLLWYFSALLTTFALVKIFLLARNKYGKEKLTNNLFISWLLLFLPPILILLLPHAPMDAGWFVVYLFFVMPGLLLVMMLLEIFWFNKATSWKKILLKYFVLFLLSYGALITWLYFNIKIDPFML